jgi:hypothetical protein
MWTHALIPVAFFFIKRKEKEGRKKERKKESRH